VLVGALTDALEAMEMQERRERGEFHISQPVALTVWNTAKETARRALATYRASLPPGVSRMGRDAGPCPATNQAAEAAEREK
jgi:hypothetical protein